MSRNVIEIIKGKYFNLSKSQKRISDYVLKNYSKVAFMTAKTLSENVQVSESTVVRYANALGFSGYPELIEALQENIKSKLTTIERFELTNDKQKNKKTSDTKRIMELDIENIKSTINQNSEEIIDGIVDELSNCRRVYILGLRSSKVLAEYLKYYLSLLFNDISVKLIESYNVFDDLVSLKEGDVLFAIAFPRYSKLTLEALRFAGDNNVTIIGLTDSKMSPIEKKCKYTLFADLSISTFIDSLVAPMSIINSLIVAISLKNKESVQNKFEKLEKVWNDYDIFE